MFIGNYQKLLTRIIQIKLKYYCQKPNTFQHCWKKSKIKIYPKRFIQFIFQINKN